MKKILISKISSIVITFILTVITSYLLHNHTIVGVVLVNIYIILTGLLNCKFKVNKLIINYISIIFSTIIIIYILIRNNFAQEKINIILILDFLFIIYFAISDNFLEIKKGN